MFSLGNILRDFVSTFLTQPTLILHGATNMTNFELWASEPALVKECCFCFIFWNHTFELLIKAFHRVQNI